MSNCYDDLRLENQLCFPLYAAARKVTGLYTSYLKPLGLTYTQYIVFMVLWETDGITVNEICDRLMLDSGTLTPLLKKLEANGYLVRKRSCNDERCVIVSLTDKGRDLQETAAQIPAKLGGCVHLSPEKASALYSLLYELLSK